MREETLEKEGSREWVCTVQVNNMGEIYRKAQLMSVILVQKANVDSFRAKMLENSLPMIHFMFSHDYLPEY